MFQGNRMSDGKCEQNIYYQRWADGKEFRWADGKEFSQNFWLPHLK